MTEIDVLESDLTTDIVLEDSEEIVVLEAPTTDVLLVGSTGPSGDPGPATEGATGQSAYQLAVSLGFIGSEAEWIASLGAGAYEHVQVNPLEVWTVQHNLGYRPAGLHIITDDGDEVDPASLAYSSDTVAVITFTEPYSGTAYLS